MERSECWLKSRDVTAALTGEAGLPDVGAPGAIFNEPGRSSGKPRVLPIPARETVRYRAASWFGEQSAPSARTA